MFDWAEAELGPVEVVVFNIGGNVRAPFREIEAKKFFKVWEMACLAGYADAARSGKAHGSARPRHDHRHRRIGEPQGLCRRRDVCSAKFALRGLTQALAREVGPLGVHVAHVVIDGAIDTQFIREAFPERYKLKDRDGLLQPDAIAETYWQIHCQPRTAWTHETELRPWIELW